MLKIYEFLVNNLDRAVIIEELIKKNSIGRNAAYQAIGWMEKNGLIDITVRGKQKEVRLRRDIHSLQFKLFLDAIRFKTLNKDVKFIAGLFASEVKEDVSVILFGSALTDKFNDIDLLIAYKDEADKESIIKIKNRVELVSDYVINAHFDQAPEVGRLLSGICLYGYDRYLMLLSDKERINSQFKEALQWHYAAANNAQDKAELSRDIERAMVNLAFAHCMLNKEEVKTKEEAKRLFVERYKVNKNIKGVREALIAIGKEIFR